MKREIHFTTYTEPHKDELLPLADNSWRMWQEDSTRPLISAYGGKTLVIVTGSERQFVMFIEEVDQVLKPLFGDEFVKEVLDKVANGEDFGIFVPPPKQE